MSMKMAAVLFTGLQAKVIKGNIDFVLQQFTPMMLH